MRNLLNFLMKYNYWFLFLLLEVTSFVLLFRFNRYQQSVFFTSANEAAGKLYEARNGIASYFHLREVNEDLLDRNMLLEQRIAVLENQLADMRSDTAAFRSQAKMSNTCALQLVEQGHDLSVIQSLIGSDDDGKLPAAALRFGSLPH